MTQAFQQGFIDKLAEGGIFGKIVQSPEALARGITFPISMPTAAIGMTPEDPRVINDRLQVLTARFGPAKGKDVVVPGGMLGARGTMSAAYLMDNLRENYPALYARIRDKVITRKNNKWQGFGRGLGRSMSEMLSSGPLPVLASSMSGLGAPRSIYRGLTAELPEEKPSFLRRWLLPEEAGAETFGRAMSVQHPAIAADLQSFIRNRWPESIE